MADFTSVYWSIFIGGVTLVSIVVLVWFVWSQAKARPPLDAAAPETMGHKWDDNLEEFNNPLPRWWMNLFYITLFWGLGYLIVYPGLGAFKGLLGWSQVSQYEQEVAQAEAEYGPLYAQYLETDIPTLATNPEVLAMGRNLYASYCTQCHGSDAGGARGFPSLVDDDWLYGSTPEAIVHSILKGRSGLMPAWVDIIGDEGVQKATDYVEHLAGRAIPAERIAAGEETYNQACIACHGPDGKGNQMLGAPNLTNDIWLYGGSRAAIVESIEKGRNGVMPAHEEFLGPAKVHVLSAYIYSFTQGNRPTR